VKYVFKTTETIRYRFPTHTNELVMDRSDAETSEAFIVVLQPGEAPPHHVHEDTEQIFYILEGRGILSVGADPITSYPVQPGDFVRIPAKTLHSIRCEGNPSLRYLSVDCFLEGRPVEEPTWESHVRVICKNNGWDFDRVKTNP